MISQTAKKYILHRTNPDLRCFHQHLLARPNSGLLICLSQPGTRYPDITWSAVCFVSLDDFNGSRHKNGNLFTSEANQQYLLTVDASARRKWIFVMMIVVAPIETCRVFYHIFVFYKSWYIFMCVLLMVFLYLNVHYRKNGRRRLWRTLKRLLHR